MSSGMNPKDVAAQCRVPLHLLPSVGIIAGAMACRQGAIDYGPYNWRERDISLMEYLSAIRRHILSIMDGHDNDEKSLVHHLGHVIATSAIILDAREVGALKDDRPTVPGMARVELDRWEATMKQAAIEKREDGTT